MGKQRQVVTQVKVQVTGGQATPAPPVGTALGPHGINIGQFVSQFNEQTRDMMGVTIPVVVTIYNDRSFEFFLKSPPAAVLLKKAAGIAKGSESPLKNKVGTVTSAQLEEIAKKKYSDLNASSVAQAKKMIAGTARSMGLTVID
ncbi:MAG: 50S ribosomal protein L11 [Planctomyces sp.]|jgi:large subunit ribosomal protein L11